MTEDEKITIRATKDGAFIVRNLASFKTSEGKEIKKRPVMTLCSCGRSSNRPFCDGTHLKVGYTSKKTDERQPDRVDDYRGEEVTIHDNRGVCSHAGHCTDNLPSVWRMDVEPWIDPDGASGEEIIRVIRMCPSGALSYTKDSVRHDSLERKPAIHISRDGPYRVVGGIELLDDEGSTPESKEHYTLCRCGASFNKPFCNGQHWYVEFAHDESGIELDE